MTKSKNDWSYTIEQSRYDYTPVLKDGTKMTTALTENACRYVTDNIRTPVLRGEWDGVTSVMGTAVVGGKL